VQPQDAYGLEKLSAEQLHMHYNKDFGIECRIARFHNIYGPYGTWKGGREKAPAAFCRKVGSYAQCVFGALKLLSTWLKMGPPLSLSIAVLMEGLDRGL
jgi:nucleoside-diphosphate-sugar epimerase